MHYGAECAIVKQELTYLLRIRQDLIIETKNNNTTTSQENEGVLIQLTTTISAILYYFLMVLRLWYE